MLKTSPIASTAVLAILAGLMAAAPAKSVHAAEAHGPSVAKQEAKKVRAILRNVS